MNLTATLRRLIKRKIATAVLVTASLAAFATLGDGGKKGEKSSLSNRFSSSTFSLRTNYNYRGNNVLTTADPNRFITVNTVITYKRGNATYIMPLKKKVMLLDKINFNPAH